MKKSEIEVHWRYPFQNQSYLDSLLAIPIEEILSTQKFIQSYETFLEFGSLKIIIVPVSTEDTSRIVLKIDKLLEEFQKKLPDGVPKYHIKTLKEQEPELILVFPDVTEVNTHFHEYFNKIFIPKLQDLNNSFKLKEHGFPQEELRMEFSFPNLEAQGIGPYMLPNMLSDFYGFELSNHVLTKNVDEFLPPPVLKNLHSVEVHPRTILYHAPKPEVEFHRLNGTATPGVSIYLDKFSDKISLYLYLFRYYFADQIHAKSLFIYKLIEKNLVIFENYTNIHTFSWFYSNKNNIYTTDRKLKNSNPDEENNYRSKTVFSSTLRNCEAIIRNSYICLYIIVLTLIYNSIKEKSAVASIIKLKNSLSILNIPLIISYAYDKTIDISIIYAYSWYFLFIFGNYPISIKKNLLTISLFSAGIYSVSTLYPPSLAYLYKKTLFLVSVLIPIFHFFYTHVHKSESFSLRFISYKIFCFSHSFYNLLKFVTRPVLSIAFKYHVQIPNIPIPLPSFILLLLLMKSYFFNSPVPFIPDTSGRTEIGYLEMPAGSSLSHTNIVSNQIESILKNTWGIKNIYAKVSKESVKYYIEKESDFEFSPNHIKHISRSTTDGFFYIPTELEQRKDLLILELRGKSPELLYGILPRLKESFYSDTSIDVIQKFKSPHIIYELYPDRGKLSSGGLTSSSIYLNSKLSQEGGIVGRVWDRERLYDLRFENRFPFQTSSEWNGFGWTDGSRKIYNGDFLTLREGIEFSILHKKNGKYTLSFYISGIDDNFVPNLDFLTEQGILWEFREKKEKGCGYALFWFLFFFLTLHHFRLV